MNKDQIKKGHEFKFKELRKVINSWELIPWAPSDEFDSLNIQILSHLYKNVSFDKLSGIIRNELIGHYGLDVENQDAELMAKQIIDCWNKVN